MSTHSHALILKASAGSGKTFALAKEFIKLLVLNPTEYHQILALTFTNDAKNEMKTRVLSELSALAANEASDMLEAIQSDFEAEKRGLTEDQIVLRSKLALTNLLNDYSRFNVNTLDHFFTQLIRHLARELKLNLGYELDLDNDKALREAIHHLYNSTDKRVKKWLRSFIRDKIDDDKGWNIEFNIKKLGGKLFQDSFIDLRDTLNENVGRLEEFVDQLHAQVKIYESSMQKLGQQALDLMTAHNLSVSDFRQHTATIFQNLSEQKQDLSKPFSATFIKGEWATKTADRKDEIEACATNGLDSLHAQLLELAESTEKQAYMEAKALLPNIYSYGVLSALSDNLWEYRTSNNLLLLSDTAFILHGVITQSDAPFIYEKIGSRYKHIMIDEFQDTSTHQWKNILPLLQHALFDEGSVMLVGDVKQSIYRWRGGDVNLLMQQAAIDLAEHTPFQRPLDTNYRSAKNIIAFNNAFFEAAKAVSPELMEGIEGKSEQLQKAYEDVHQHNKKALEGYVNVQFFSDNEDTPWKEKALEATFSTIQKVLDHGFVPEDIMVLVRKNKEAAETAEFLLHKGVHTLTDEALYLEKSPLVQFLVHALELSLTPEDSFVQTGFNYFYHLIQGKSASESIVLPRELTQLSGLSQHISAYEAIEQLIEHYRLNQKFDPFLQGFQDVCLTQAKKGYSSIASFLERWKELNTDGNNIPSIVLGSPKGAVRVKSIHKSKGLESAVVIMPMIGGNLYNPQHIFWPANLPESYASWGSLALPLTGKLEETRFSPAYEEERYEIFLEELNTLYVAFTRAVEQLYIYANSSQTKNSTQKLVQGILAHPQFELSSYYTEDTFELGTPGTASASASESTGSSSLTSYPVSSPDTKLAPPAASRFWQERESERSTPVREGIALHALMAQLSHFQEIELDMKLGKILDQMALRGQLSTPQKPLFKEKVKNLFTQNPQLMEWYTPDWEVLTEHKIFAKGETYIPDRVAIKENKAIILDYKREQHSEAHKAQIRGYGNLLTEMGYVVEGQFLVYIDDLEMVEVE